MNKTNNGIKPLVGTSKLVRAKFGPGMLLQHEDLELLNTYTRDLSRVMFKSFFGCGVICGLVVTTDPKCDTITISAGVALSCSGDPIWVPKGETFKMNESCDSGPRKDLRVKLCAKVSNCGPRTAVCSSDEDESTSEWTRERLGYEISLVETLDPGCGCGCPDPDPTVEKEVRIGDPTTCRCVNPELPTGDPKYRCYEKHYAGECECSCDDCGGCACDCVWLAKVKWDDKNLKWLIDHRPRRFVRPVLMRDPQVAIEEAERNKTKEQTTEMEGVQRAASNAVDYAMTEIAEKAVKLELTKNPAVMKRLQEVATVELLKKIKPETAMTDVVRDVATESERAELLESIREDAKKAKLEAANREAVMKAELAEYREKLKALEATQPTGSSAVDATAPAEGRAPEPAPDKTQPKKKQTTTKKPDGGTQ